MGLLTPLTEVGHKVLLSIEDDDAEYHLIKMAVDEINMAIHLLRVKDGEEAMWFLKRSHGHEIAPRPDLILLNLNLPKKNGFEVLTDLQHSESLRSIPVVMFTSTKTASERKKALALGADDFISKPNTLDELLETIKAVCSRFLA